MYKTRLGKIPKKCKDCGNFLDYRNETGYCKLHSGKHRFAPRYCRNCTKRLIGGQKIYCSRICMKEYNDVNKSIIRQEYLKALSYCKLCDKRLLANNSSANFCYDCKSKYKTIIKKHTYSIEILRYYVQCNYNICKVHRVFYQTDKCPVCNNIIKSN